MSAYDSDIQSQQQAPQQQLRKGLAIASLILGIISIPTISLLGVGAITAIVLGVIALGRIKKEPAAYSGKNMAIAGITTGAVSLLLTLFFGILAAVAIPRVLKNLQIGRQFEAAQTLIIIQINQTQFQATRQGFGTLKELSEAGYIDSKYASGATVNGYIYASVGETTKDKYCIQATRQSPSYTEGKDFNVTEDGGIRFVESKTPSPVACGQGSPLGGAGSSAGAGAQPSNP
jgi:hypothetical protein